MIDTSSFQRKSNITFMKALDTAKKMAFYTKVATTIKSTGSSETYEWLGDFPAIKEFLGTRQIEAFREHSYTLTNKKYEVTIGVDLDKMDDNPGYVEPRLKGMAQKFANHPSRLMIDLMVDGTTDLCYDGKAFYATDHPVDGDAGSTFSNLLTGAGVTVAHIKTDWGKVTRSLLEYEGRDGDVLFDDIGKIEVVYPAELQQVFEEAFEAVLISTGGSNVVLKKAELTASGRLSDAKDWYANKVDSFIKPFVLQDRKGVVTEWNDRDKFDKDILYFGGKARYVAGYTLPQLSIKVNNT